MIRFAAPEWLLLLPFLLHAVWRWPGARLGSPLRVAILVLLVLSLAEARSPSGSSGLDLWLLLDRSESAAEPLERRREEIERLLERSRSAADRLRVVEFAADAQERGVAGEGFGEARGETRLAAAVRYTLGRLDAARPSRLLVVSDGYATEPLDGLAERLAEERVALDLRLLTRQARGDYRLVGLAGPARVQPGEPFLLELRVAGEPDADVPVVLHRDGAPIGRAVAELRGGRAALRVSDRLAIGGAHRYSATLLAEGDPLPGNDRAHVWVDVAGGPRALLVSAYHPDPLAASLAGHGFEVETPRDLAALGPGRLAGARLLILNNVPAYSLPRPFLDAIDAWVRVQGGGLLMAGGRWSFGAGGYFDSPVDALLPVSMELRREHHRLAVALAIVLDRSGSMGAAVAGGATKMDLANAGAARSLELLGANDAAAVFAVDSEAHEVLPLARLGEGRERAIAAVRRIGSGGGGIFVHRGLEAAWQSLREAQVGQRHVILFADAADAEEPGDYPALVGAMVAGGATLSVIGLGTPSDRDADLLMGLAALGGGRIFFSADPATLPALFAQETVAVARSAFLEETVPVQPHPEWHELAARPLAGLEAVDGYNLSYLREGASAALSTADEQRAPLIAFWRRGGGRVAAVSFPLGGEHSERVRGWRGYGDFAQTLARWLMGDRLPPGLGLRSSLDGTHLELELLFDQRWDERLARAPARVLLAGAPGQEPSELVWERLAPGRFRASAPLEAGRVHSGAVAIGDTRLAFGPLELAHEAEWSFDARRRSELIEVAAASGGRQLDDLRDAWRRSVARAPRSLRAPLLATALLLFLAEALRTRAGWRWPRLGLAAPRRTRRESPRGPSASAAARPGGTEPVARDAAPADDEQPATEADRRARRYRAAKWRG